jgi:hypothetical protein
MDAGPLVLAVALVAIVGAIFAGLAAFAWAFSRFGTESVAEDFAEGGPRSAEHEYTNLNR